ncbi:MAG TPA: hypothetical protein VLG92_01230 [Candidatus Saccharimonadia bacterium]|nr:hypothetical protein [Candidatus Saccharimonadia bacterium]
MEPKPEPTAAEPEKVQATTPEAMPAPEQTPKLEAPNQLAQTPPAPPVAVAAPPQPPVSPAKSSQRPKMPVLGIVLSVLVFVGLATVAYYAYSKTN